MKCERCQDTGFMDAGPQTGALDLNGNVVPGHTRAVTTCVHVLEARESRRKINQFGSEYVPSAQLIDLALPEQVERGGLFAIGCHRRRLGLLIKGGMGTGKTYMASAVANEALKLNCRSLTFAGTTQLFRQARILIRQESSDERLSEEDKLLLDVDLLVLDDLGSEKITGWTEEYLYHVVSERYARELPLIVTTNLTLAELQIAIGDRSMDRIMGFCEGKPFTIEGKTRRWRP